MVMDVQNAPEYILPKKGPVRVMELIADGYRQVGKNSIKIDLTLFANPAGYIPV
jgi:hypothetical protein